MRSFPGVSPARPCPWLPNGREDVDASESCGVPADDNLSSEVSPSPAAVATSTKETLQVSKKAAALLARLLRAETSHSVVHAEAGTHARTRVGQE